MPILDRASQIGFIGAGIVGKSLAVALNNNGYTVSAVGSRSFDSAKSLADIVPCCEAYQNFDEVAQNSDVVFITTTDDAIASIADAVKWRRGQGVAHCSGAASIDVLAGVTAQEAIPGALHPLQTFSSVDDAVRTLPGSTFAIEGAGPIRQFLETLTADLGGISIHLRPQDKPLYHASVVMMGGLLTGLAGTVAEMWKEFGIQPDAALQSLIPMIRGNAITLGSVGMPEAIAGPYVRGDIGTIRKHLVALSSQAPNVLPVYCEMALAALPHALEKGNVPENVASQIRILLEEFLEG